MKEVTIKIEDEVYEYYKGLEERGVRTVEEIIVEAIQECFEGEI